MTNFWWDGYFGEIGMCYVFMFCWLTWRILLHTANFNLNSSSSCDCPSIYENLISVIDIKMYPCLTQWVNNGNFQYNTFTIIFCVDLMNDCYLSMCNKKLWLKRQKTAYRQEKESLLTDCVVTLNIKRVVNIKKCDDGCVSFFCELVNWMVMYTGNSLTLMEILC